MRLSYYPAPELEICCDAVELFDRVTMRHVAKMFKIMSENKGMGLAANQIGLLKRIVVVKIPLEANQYEKQQDYHGENLVFINPTLSDFSTETRSMKEGCLSFPKVQATVKRPTAVSVLAQNEKGEKFVTNATGILARVLQHEVDHLNGINMLQRALNK